jgi:hypothetical protein
VNWARRSGSPFPGGSLAEWRRTVGRLRGSWRQLLGRPLRAMRHPYPRGQMGPLRGPPRHDLCRGPRERWAQSYRPPRSRETGVGAFAILNLTGSSFKSPLT